MSNPKKQREVWKTRKEVFGSSNIEAEKLSKYIKVEDKNTGEIRIEPNTEPMTPQKEKAKELVLKYWNLYPQYNIGTGKTNYRKAKQCALIAVEIILQFMDSDNKRSHIAVKDVKFWQQVKEEINKL